MMFSVIRPSTCTITDIDLATYLMLRGAKLEGLEIIQPKRAAFTFSHKHLSDFIHEYHQGQEIRFSPKVLFDFRYKLKNMVSTAILRP